MIASEWQAASLRPTPVTFICIDGIDDFLEKEKKNTEKPEAEEPQSNNYHHNSKYRWIQLQQGDASYIST